MKASHDGIRPETKAMTAADGARPVLAPRFEGAAKGVASFSCAEAKTGVPAIASTTKVFTTKFLMYISSCLCDVETREAKTCSADTRER
jgi:hypothetical protein